MRRLAWRSVLQFRRAATPPSNLVPICSNQAICLQRVATLLVLGRSDGVVLAQEPCVLRFLDSIAFDEECGTNRTEHTPGNRSNVIRGSVIQLGSQLANARKKPRTF